MCLISQDFIKTVETKRKPKFLEICKIEITGESKRHLFVQKICKINNFLLVIF